MPLFQSVRGFIQNTEAITQLLNVSGAQSEAHFRFGICGYDLKSALNLSLRIITRFGLNVIKETLFVLVQYPKHEVMLFFIIKCLTYFSAVYPIILRTCVTDVDVAQCT